MKGYAKIELTNIHTGEKEVVEKHNIVTNAIQDMLKTYGVYSPAIFVNSQACAGFNITSCYGGLIAWDGTIEESKENYKFKPYGVNAGAHAAYQVVNSGTDALLGSYNASESKITDNSAKFVYDFATNQGNGTISCITLVSQLNGLLGFDSVQIPPLSGVSIYRPYVNNTFNKMIPFPSESKLVNVDKLVNIYKTPSITITEYNALLTNTFSIFHGTTPVKSAEVTLSASDLCDYSNPKLAEGKYCPIYYDPNTKTISVVLCTDTSTVNEVTISTVNVLTHAVTKRKVNITSHNMNLLFAIHYKNYLLYGSNMNKMYIMNLTTGTVSPETVDLETFSSDRVQIYPLNDDEFIIFGNSTAYNIRKLINLKDIEQKTLAQNTSYPSYYQPTNYSFYPSSDLYFGTINNLSSPVVKTADKTMKITYTLTEGE